MGIKEVLERMNEKNKLKKEKIRAMAEDIKMQRIVNERLKNSDERELDRFYEEERQKQIKENLEEFRKVKQRNLWSSNIFKHDKIFNNHTSVLTDNPKLSIMKGKKSLPKVHKGKSIGALNRSNMYKMKKKKGGKLYLK